MFKNPVGEEQQKTKEQKSQLYFVFFILLVLVFSIFIFNFCSHAQNKQSIEGIITYIWLGNKQLNLNFQRRLSYIDYPHKILGNDEWERLGTAFHKFDLQVVSKSDILRLLYLYENGGIYMDTDANVDYDCLMKLLGDKKGFWMAGESWNQYFPPASNWLLYSSEKNSEKIKTILKDIEEFLQTSPTEDLKQDQVIYMKLAGPGRIFTSGAKILYDVYKCTDHIGLGSWSSKTKIKEPDQ